MWFTTKVKNIRPYFRSSTFLKAGLNCSFIPNCRLLILFPVACVVCNADPINAAPAVTYRYRPSWCRDCALPPQLPPPACLFRLTRPSPTLLPLCACVLGV